VDGFHEIEVGSQNVSIERVGIIATALRGGPDILEPFTFPKSDPERRLVARGAACKLDDEANDRETSS